MGKNKEPRRQKTYNEHLGDAIPQVGIRIASDFGHTADFLRELADAIEKGEPTNFETRRGAATITWPDTAEKFGTHLAI